MSISSRQAGERKKIKQKRNDQDNLHVILLMKTMKTNMIKIKNLLRGVVAKTEAELHRAVIANNSKKVQEGNNKEAKSNRKIEVALPHRKLETEVAVLITAGCMKQLG